jgi:hypothetical protein
MDGRNKRKRRNTSCGLWHKDARARSPSITSVESSVHASVSESWETTETRARTSFSQPMQTAVEKSTLPEGGGFGTLSPGITDACEDTDSRYQIIQSLEGGMSDILRFEDAVGVMTSVLVNTVKIRIQAGKFGFEQINIGTTTNIADIRKYTEQSLVKLPFEVAAQKIAKSGAGCVGISLLKAWEEAFYWDII